MPCPSTDLASSAQSVRSVQSVHAAGEPVLVPSVEPVAVRTEILDGVPTPVQLIRGGRLWLVRRADREPGPDERWRVQVAAGPGTAPVLLWMWGGADDRWSVLDAAPADCGEGARV